MENNEEFIQEFVSEARGHIVSIEQGLLKIDTGASGEVINGIFRAVHSIKGTAGFFGLKNIVELAHMMENLFGELRTGKLTFVTDMTDVLLTANDTLSLMIENVAESSQVDIGMILHNLSALMAGEREILEVVNVIVVDGEKNEVPLSSYHKRELQEAIRFGHKLYKVRLRFNEDLLRKNVTPIQFFKAVESIGRIIDSYTDISAIDTLEACLDSDMNFIFLVTTVLEKELLVSTLGIPLELISELNINMPHDDFSAALYSESNVHRSTPIVEKRAEQAATENQSNVPVQLQDKVILEDDTKAMGITNVEETLRVSVNLLNELLTVASEMVLGRNQLLRILAGQGKKIPGLDAILQHINYITTELQEKVMQTRMQSVGNVFNKFPRIIRDLSRKMGKNIELIMTGSEVELDKSIVELLGDPLTHLVRNALDHGIEMPDIRKKVGKSLTGTVVIKAYHEGGHVTIDIVDDGAGIPVEKVKAKAIGLGLVSQHEVDNMSEREVLNLIFYPGFSTAEQITDVSGRGVGMDVVKTNIEKLGGIIEIYTVVGKGTTFRLNLPLTLAIIPSLIVEVVGQKFALPQVNLQEMVRVKRGDLLRQVEQINSAQVLRLRGVLLPVISLAEVLGVGPYPVENDIIRILVLKVGFKRFGLVVDVIHDGEEILVKPLPTYLKNCHCYSGVTILGDGKTAMILDPDGIAASANLKFVENSPQEKNIREEVGKEEQSLLLFKCSGTEMFALDLAMVARVEEVNSTQIETLGQQEYIKFRGDALRLIRPEYFLPVTRGDHKQSQLYVIILKLVKYPVGILIEKIHDNIQGNIVFNQDHIKAKGVLGTTILNQHIVLMLNVYELLEEAMPEHRHLDKERENNQNCKILLAEDTAFFAKMEESYLKGAGYQVVTVGNGLEAWNILQTQHFDVLISDINMPLMDGLELVKKIRADDKLRRLPVIAVTSLSGDHYQRQGREAGFDFYELKLDKGTLLDRIDEILQRRGQKV